MSNRLLDLKAHAADALAKGDLTGAVDAYGRIIDRYPEQAEAYYKRGNAQNRLGRWESALADYDRAVALDPRYAYAFCNRGAVLERLGRWDESLASYDRAVALDPGDSLAQYNRGSVLRELDRFDAALASYDAAIALKGDYVEAYVNRGHVLQRLGRPVAAIESYDRAIDLKPVYAEAFLGRGTVLFGLRKVEAAVENYDRAIELDPDNFDALQSRGFALLALGRIEAAIASYDRAFAVKPDFPFLLGMRRYARMQVCDWDDLERDMLQVIEGLEARKPVCAPFQALGLLDSARLQRLAAEIWIRDEVPCDDSLGAIARRVRGGKIRIGYFSADFRDHAVAVLTAKLFEVHDRSRFEITAFAFGPGSDDPMRARLRGAFDRFIEVGEQSDRQVAVLARELSIDIAVDLGGFTEHCRTGIFALRAAPLQLSYIGYLGTMGAPYMDYLVADPAIIPADRREHYREKIIYLPFYQANDTQRRIADRTFTRAELRLPATGFVFSCFNNNYKVTPATFGSWMRILERVPGSCLCLYAGHELAERNLRRAAQSFGLDPSRIVFGRRVAFEYYMARYRTMDLFLDTLPYNAGTTASDALWMGLPVLTCAGDGFAGRVAASLLTALQLPELVTTSAADYENMAVRLATDPAALAEVRRKLARNRISSPLFDMPTFTRGLESAYERIYDRYHTGLPPDDIQPDRR